MEFTNCPKSIYRSHLNWFPVARNTFKSRLKLEQYVIKIQEGLNPAKNFEELNEAFLIELETSFFFLERARRALSFDIITS